METESQANYANGRGGCGITNWVAGHAQSVLSTKCAGAYGETVYSIFVRKENELRIGVWDESADGKTDATRHDYVWSNHLHR